MARASATRRSRDSLWIPVDPNPRSRPPYQDLPTTTLAMDSAFAQPHCPATYPTSSTIPTVVPLDPALPQVRNDALVYLAIAVAGFAAVPTLFWLRDKRHKDRERRRNRAVVESLKAKMDATRALSSTVSRAPEVAKPVARVVAPVEPEPTLFEDVVDLDPDEMKEKKKRSKDRRKRGRDQPSRIVRNKKRVPSPAPAPPPSSEDQQDSFTTDYTPRAPEQSCLSDVPNEPRAPSPRPPSMLDIASPTPVSLISTSFHSPSSPQTRSETSSHPGQSRSASVSPTTAPLTPPPLSTSASLPPLVAVKSQETEAWVPTLSQIPRDDPAWDWDGQSSTYSAGSPSRAPSSSSSHPRQSVSGRPQVMSKSAVTQPAASSSASPAGSEMPSAPSLVFPSLNSHPPPGASLTTQIASLKGALEASRVREHKHRRDAEHWSKECDLMKWRWNDAADMWRRREAELQAQIHHLVLQLQTITHAMQAASLSPPISFMPAPGQGSFPLAMPFPSHHGSPFGMPPASASPDLVNEDLAEAILKRPGSIRPAAASTSRNGMHRSGEVGATLAEDTRPQQQTNSATSRDKDEVIEFEFPTLLERPVNSPRVDVGREPEPATGAEDVEIFN